MFAQGCAESWHHVPGAPEADPGCHPVPPSPGYPNARPRRAGLTAGRDGESAAPDPLVCADGRHERGKKRADPSASCTPPTTPTLPPASLLPRFLRTPAETSSVPVVTGGSRDVKSRHIYCDLYLHLSRRHVTGSGSGRKWKCKDRKCLKWDGKTTSL